MNADPWGPAPKVDPVLAALTAHQPVDWDWIYTPESGFVMSAGQSQTQCYCGDWWPQPEFPKHQAAEVLTAIQSHPGDPAMSRAQAAETGLKFYPASHRYKLDGKWVRGVTTLIKGGMPNDALKYWSARTVAEFVADNRDLVGRLYPSGRGPMVAYLKEIPWQRRDDAGVRGTEVHAIAEKLIHGEEVAVPDHIAGHVDACVAFLDDWKPKGLVVERPLASREHWYAGTPDMFAELPDGRKILFDWKTADSGIWPETAYQLTAYRYAEFFQAEDGTEQPVPEVDFCAAVHLTTDGYEVIPVKSDADVFAEFLAIAEVAGAAKRSKGNKTERGYVLDPLPRPGQEDVA